MTQDNRILSAIEHYWTKHNVSNHRTFPSVEASIDYFKWRNAQYYGYLDLMPVRGYDDCAILDFGCGPGHDLVGFAAYSKPRRLVGVDVAESSLREARDRLALHSESVELLWHDVQKGELPVEPSSIDVIHSSGVLHHMLDPTIALWEFNRVLKPGGVANIMVYNWNSIWTHLYVAYQRQIIEGRDSSLDLAGAFSKSTDGPDCPISRAYKKDEFVSLVESCGFNLERFGVAVSVWEMSLLPKRFDALMCEGLPSESRDFLYSLRFDSYGLPLFEGYHAGIDGCYRFSRL